MSKKPYAHIWAYATNLIDFGPEIGIWFFAPIWTKINLRVPETTSYKYSTHNLGFVHFLGLFGIIRPKIVGGWGSGPFQKCGHGS